MGIVRNNIFESPDNVYVRGAGRSVEWDEVEYKPLTFSFYKGKFYWSDEIVDRYSGVKGDEDVGNKAKRVRVHYEIAKKHNLKYTDSDGEEKDVKIVKDKMENAIVTLKVPSKVDIALGKSWGEAKE